MDHNQEPALTDIVAGLHDDFHYHREMDPRSPMPPAELPTSTGTSTTETCMVDLGMEEVDYDPWEMESDDERESDRDSETDSDKDIPIKDTGSGPDAETQEGCENSRSMFGRTYHGFRDHSRRSDTFGRFKPYFRPTDNDEREHNLLDRQHDLIRVAQDYRLFVCPADSEIPLTIVLDAGCGSGIWGRQVAEEYPDACVDAIDISYPRKVNVDQEPQNFYFRPGDLDRRLKLLPPYNFGLIYGRFLAGSITDWPKFMRRSFQALRPGGWLELCDFKYPMDGISRQYSALHRWNELLMEASERLGIPLTCTRNYRTQMVQAGFRRVQEQVYHWPLGAWEKGGKNQYIGRRALEIAIDSLETLALMSFTKAFDWSEQQVRSLCEAAAADLRDRHSKVSLRVTIIYGQRPWEVIGPNRIPRIL